MEFLDLMRRVCDENWEMLIFPVAGRLFPAGSAQRLAILGAVLAVSSTCPEPGVIPHFLQQNEAVKGLRLDPSFSLFNEYL